MRFCDKIGNWTGKNISQFLSLLKNKSDIDMLVSDTSYFRIIFGYNELFLKTSPELHKLVIGFENEYALRADHFEYMDITGKEHVVQIG